MKLTSEGWEPFAGKRQFVRKGRRILVSATGGGRRRGGSDEDLDILVGAYGPRPDVPIVSLVSLYG